MLAKYQVAAKQARDGAITTIPAELKPYESFKGRINFSDFVELFNFESRIYQDKQFKYSLISNYNKRLIPEYISAALSKLIFDELVDIDIRSKLEQYLIAIMSNMDYFNYATTDQLKDVLSDTSDLTYHYIIGSCPLSYREHKFLVLADRVTFTSKFFNEVYGENSLETAIINIEYKQGEHHEKSLYEQQLKPIINRNKHINAHIQKDHSDNPSSKLTKHEISKILEQIKDLVQVNDNYNLFLFTSTFHISKVAYELEKYFYEEPVLKYPSNVYIIGTEKFYDLITNRRIEETKSNIVIDDLLTMRKMQSFLYEIFMHSLDRNQQK